MKALVYTAPNEVTYRDEPEPALSGDDVLICIDAVGICGSDMHAYHGHDPRRVPPLILGHELVGRILDGPTTGRRVTVNPLITCGTCEYCRQGRDNLCANRTMIGMTRAGGFAERMTTAARSVIDIPQDMSARAAVLTEPAATALHAIDRATRALVRPLPECNVLVLGGGAQWPPKRMHVSTILLPIPRPLIAVSISSWMPWALRRRAPRRSAP